MDLRFEGGRNIHECPNERNHRVDAPDVLVEEAQSRAARNRRNLQREVLEPFDAGEPPCLHAASRDPETCPVCSGSIRSVEGDLTAALLERYDVRELYRVEPLSNLAGILKYGIFSRSLVYRLYGNDHPGLDISGRGPRRNRADPLDGGRGGWEYVPLYFNPRNEATYMMTVREPAITPDRVAVLSVDPSILRAPGLGIADRNLAARSSVRVTWGPRGLRDLDWDLIRASSYLEEKGDRHRQCAEALVPDHLPRDYLRAIYVRSPSAKKRAREGGIDEPITIEPHLFHNA